MRLAFAGTPEFAEVALRALMAAGHQVALVLTQPDRPAGRGMKLHPSPVKVCALANGVGVVQPRSLRLDGKLPEDAAAAREALAAAKIEVMVVAAYGLILPQWVLDLPPRGCVNIHASLLPRWRGAAPIHRAIEAGDPVTGITVMQMDAGLDTGDMLLSESHPIGPRDTTALLHDALAELGGRLVVEALRQGDALQRTPQPEAGVTYAQKVDKREAAIDWALPADQIERRIRAFDPFPGSSSVIDGEVWKIWQAHRTEGKGAPGTVLAASDIGLTIACGDAAVCATELQRPGGKRLPASQFLQGQPPRVGRVFEPRRE